MRAIRLSSVRFIAVAISVIVLTSCSLLNPHVKWDTPKGDNGEVIPASKFTIDKGIEYAENAKTAYKDALANESYLTSFLGIGLIPIAATALGLGMTGHHPTAVTVLGLTAASGYAVGTLLSRKPNQRAWVAGYNATSCTIDAVLPLLYIEKNKDNIKNKVTALDKAISDVEGGIGKTRRQLLMVGDKPPPQLIDIKIFAEQRIAEAEKLLSDSRETRRAAEKMLQDEETAGEALVQAVDRISGLVSQQIIENAPDITTLGSIIGGLAQSYGQFVSVPEGLRPAPPIAGKAQSTIPLKDDEKNKIEQKDENLRGAIGELQAQIIILQGVATIVANIINAVASSKPIDTLKACGAKVEQIAQLLTVEPSGRIEFQAGKGATAGRVIKGGSAPYSVSLQGDSEGPVVRQTEPFGPAFTVQTTNNTPAKEYSIYISDKAGQRIFIPVDVKSGAGVEPLTGDPLSDTANELSSGTYAFDLDNPKVAVKIVKAEVVNKLLKVDFAIKADQNTVDKITDAQLLTGLLTQNPLKKNKITKEMINVREKKSSK